VCRAASLWGKPLFSAHSAQLASALSAGHSACSYRRLFAPSPPPLLTVSAPPRYHHRTAVNSIMHQLATNNVQAAPPSPAMLKSSSRTVPPNIIGTSSEDDDFDDDREEDFGDAADLRFSEDFADLVLDDLPPPPPATADSWASTAIESSRLSIIIPPPPPKRSRSGSSGSSQGSETRSPGGFWVKRPTSPIKDQQSFGESPGGFMPGLELNESAPSPKGFGLLEEVGMKRANMAFQSSTCLSSILDLEATGSSEGATAADTSASR